MRSRELSNIDVAVYAVYKLGGIDKKIHTERIAIECFRMAPDRFCWRLPEYRNFPDKDIVRAALTDARKPKNGGLLTGRTGVEATGKEADGWTVTPQGAKWITENLERMEESFKASGEPIKRPDVQRILRRFRQEKCYQTYLREGNLENVSEYEFKDMLHCSPDAYAETIRREFDRLKAQAEIVKDDSILSFLGSCERVFAAVMATKEAK